MREFAGLLGDLRTRPREGVLPAVLSMLFFTPLPSNRQPAPAAPKSNKHDEAVQKIMLGNMF